MRQLPTALMAALVVLTEAPTSHAVRFEVLGRRRPPHQRHQRRDNSATLVDTGDISYHTNLTLGGVSFDCLIDTGSSDLWVAGTVPGASSTGFTTGVTYAVGQVQGPIKLGNLQFAGFTVPQQAYLEVTPDDDNPQGTGLIGLGPSSGSNIYETVGTPAAATVLDQIFIQNTATPNFLTVLLGRKDDPSDTYSGTITVGEVLSNYNAVTNQPKLTVTDVPISEVGDQHFQILLDENGLFGPDGNVIPIQTVVQGTQDKKQATAVIDTGFSLPQLPKAAADAIYSSFPGSEFTTLDDVGQVWVVPCKYEVNITFQFGGVKYPIHPLDATLDPQLVGISRVRNSAGDSCCIGTFQPFSFDAGAAPNYDMILGMSFLRNVYTLIDYGDFVVGSTSRDAPYIQFLSTTDPAEAHSDFVKVRLDGVDTTTNQNQNPNGGGGSSSPDGQDDFNKSKMAVIGIVAGVVILALAGLSGLIWLWRNRKSRNAYRHQRLSGSNYAGFGMAMVAPGPTSNPNIGPGTPYHSLQHPPPPPGSMLPVPGTNTQGYVAGYTGYTGGYQTPTQSTFYGGATDSESHYVSSAHGWSGYGAPNR